ncbi:MAG TPA: DUF4907 domain-containing protein [Puia sp.]|nr:DUF4907 domain-containing protein [Puia sp.]
MPFFRKWGLSLAMVLVIIGTFGYGFYKRWKWKQEHSLVELKAIEVPGGWGYDILKDGRPLFHQYIMPGIPGNRVFRSKEDALAVGKVVYDRLLAGQPPTITEKEMRDMHIDIPPDATDSAAKDTVHGAKGPTKANAVPLRSDTSKSK